MQVGWEMRNKEVPSKHVAMENGRQQNRAGGVESFVMSPVGGSSQQYGCESDMSKDELQGSAGYE
jgi:hypothetical protein